MKHICKECGEEFEATNGNQKYCSKQHFRTCVVCGEKFEVSNSQLAQGGVRKTCSRKCTAELKKKTNMEKYGGPAPMSNKKIQEKAKITTKERYGVEHAMQSDICKEKSKQTNLERYGVEHYSQTEEYKKKFSDMWNQIEFKDRVVEARKATCLNRYGVENPTQLDWVKQKAKDTYKAKTGYEHPFQNPEVQAKMIENSKKVWGTEHPQQSDEVKQKIITSLNELYADDAYKDEINARRKQKNLLRYGVDNPMKDPVIKKKQSDALIAHYGVPVFSQTSDWRKFVMKDPTKIDNFELFKEDPKTYVEVNFDSKPSIKELSDNLGISKEHLGQLLIENNLHDLVAYVFSYMEKDVFEYIQKINTNLEVIRNTKRVITPYELDLYIPELNMAIECNPTATHNSSIDFFSNSNAPKEPMYHKMKTEMCEKEGIFLFHIFGYEWTHKKDVIKSMIANLLGKNNTKIFARNTEIKEVSSSESREFLDKNHRQGSAQSSIRLGLYFNDELVSLMTFGDTRNTIGKSSKYESELIRFCSKIDTSVIGGASKLFKYYVDIYDPHTIVSYSDKAHTRGKLYDLLGFTKVSESGANYSWVHIKTDKSYHRINAQKRNVKKFLHDDSIDLEKTEKEIMEEHGFVQVFDSGVCTWVWTKGTTKS